MYKQNIYFVIENTDPLKYMYGTEQRIYILYRCNSFIVDLRHKFTVRNMNDIPVFVQYSELSNRT